MCKRIFSPICLTFFRKRAAVQSECMPDDDKGPDEFFSLFIIVDFFYFFLCVVLSIKKGSLKVLISAYLVTLQVKRALCAAASKN
jgi:hypothetical protein